MYLSIIVPAHNEEDVIRKTFGILNKVAKGLKCDYEIIIIDDGSTDNTNKILKELQKGNRRLKILKNAVKSGPGYSVKRGVFAAKGDVMVTSDADLSYSPLLIPKLVEKIQEGYDMVIASPYMPGGNVEGVSPFRLLISKLGSMAYRIGFMINLYCFTSYFRAFRKNILEGISIESNGFEMMTEMTIKLHRAGYKITEIPATLKKRSTGFSKFKVMKEIRKNLMLLFRLNLDSLWND